jgi:hypothetical protein
MPVIKTCTAILVAWVALGAVPATFVQQGIVPPLRTSGHQIVDAAGHPVRLTSVNWYGFDQKESMTRCLNLHADLCHPKDWRAKTDGHRMSKRENRRRTHLTVFR